jgi:tetratricopeptide (TPR) repeat protein
MKSKGIITTVSVVTILLGFGLVFVLSNFVQANRPPTPEGYEDEDLAMQGSKLKDYSLGFNGLIADWYWMQSLQYIGGKVLKGGDNISIDDLNALNPRLLYPMLDNATTLDPQFIPAYTYGALVLPAIDKEKAIAIAKKGIENNPKEWRLYQYLGYIYWKLGRYDEASDAYQKGSEIEGAPIFMRMMTATMKTKGGSRDTAREMYRQMYDGAEDDQTKKSAEFRLKEIQSLDERDAIGAALQNFKERTGRCAARWSEILPLLRQVHLPAGEDFVIDKENDLVDPSGAPYILNKEECRVSLDETKTKIPLR